MNQLWQLCSTKCSLVSWLALALECDSDEIMCFTLHKGDYIMHSFCLAGGWCNFLHEHSVLALNTSDIMMLWTRALIFASHSARLLGACNEQTKQIQILSGICISWYFAHIMYVPIIWSIVCSCSVRKKTEFLFSCHGFFMKAFNWMPERRRERNCICQMSVGRLIVQTQHSATMMHEYSTLMRNCVDSELQSLCVDDCL